MDDKIIVAPAVAPGTRTLGLRRAPAPVVVPLAKSRAETPRDALQAERDLHAECRARESALDGELRRELAAASAEELERERKRAHEEGLAAGREEGEIAAVAQAGIAAAQRRERFEALLMAIERAHDAALESAREGAVAIGFAAACRIVGERLATAEGVRAAVEQVLERTRAGERVTVRLCAEDLARLGESNPLEAAKGRRVDFVGDASLAPGDCCVDSASGTLEARLRAQVEALCDALLAAHRAPPAGERE